MPGRAIATLVLMSSLLTACATVEPQTTTSAVLPRNPEQLAESSELRRQIRGAINAQDWTLAGQQTLLLDPGEAANRDVLRQSLAFLGRDDLLAPFRRETSELERCSADPEARPGDALNEIVRRARDHSVVVINEAHDEPRHRAFAETVIRALRAEGFDTFAAETFRHPTDAMTARGFVTAADGYYTRDPIFAQLAHTAMQLGYRMVAYEFTGPYPEGASGEARVELREQRQAEQLFERTFAHAPDTRLVVLVGYGHVREEPRPPGSPGPPLMMATHLKRMLGRDILTVEQTACGSNAAIQDRSEQGFLRTDRAEAGTPPAVDLQIVRGAERVRHGRATWRLRNGADAISIPGALLRHLRQHADVAVIEARIAGADAASIPEDRLLWRPQDRDLRLVLRPGDYELTALGAGRQVIAVTALRVRPTRAR